ncbi:MAG: hypothetical protein U0903_19795 [Planctomycetales bacterium]
MESHPCCILLDHSPPHLLARGRRTENIVIVAVVKKSHGPEGNGIHDYTVRQARESSAR